MRGSRGRSRGKEGNGRKEEDGIVKEGEGKGREGSMPFACMSLFLSIPNKFILLLPG